MNSSAERHRRIATLQAGIMGGIAAIVAVFTLVFGGVQTVQNSDAQEAVAAAEARSDFWQIIAGEQVPVGATSANKLAVELRDNLGSLDPGATQLPAEIQEFSAGPSDYPGIAGELGLHPFNDEGLACADCGPLNAYVQNRLLDIKQGQIDEVVATEIGGAPEVGGLTLTPFGMNGMLWYGFLYAAGSIGALVIAIRKDSRANDYPDRLLNWKRDGGSSADPYKRVSHVLSPLYFVTVVPWRRKRGYDFRGVLKEINMTQLYDTLKGELGKLDMLEPAERDTSETRLLRGRIDEALEQIRDAAVKYDRSAATTEQNANEVRRGIEQNLNEVFVALELRASAYRELDSDFQVLPTDVPSLMERRQQRIEEQGDQTRQTGA